MSDWLDVFIVALLPLTALFTVVQKQPYFALVSRGILGVVAVLLYAVMGAADVALTEALVGTLLTVMLYAIAVRSSHSVRIGVLAGNGRPPPDSPIRRVCISHKLSLRWAVFDVEKELVKALKEGRVDAVYLNPRNVPSLGRLLPADTPENQYITLLAEHSRWHERKINDTVGEDERVVRINLGTGKGSR